MIGGITLTEYEVTYKNYGNLFTESQAVAVARMVRSAVNMDGDWVGLTYGVDANNRLCVSVKKKESARV